jgi:hypothetical protein
MHVPPNKEGVRDRDAHLFAHYDGPRALVDDNFGEAIRIDCQRFQFSNSATNSVCLSLNVSGS